MENSATSIKSNLQELRGTVSKPISKKLQLDKVNRMVEKLDSFSASCEDCQQYLGELNDCLLSIKENPETIDDTNLHRYKKLISNISSHLQKKHKLIEEGHYLAICMSIGMGIGMVLGLTVFDNIGLGLPIGMCLGLAIGAGLDEDAKKKGKTF